MNTELLQRIISEGRQLATRIVMVERDITLEPNCNYVFVGLRQVGKSYMLYARIKEMLKQGTPIESIVLINFDDERINLRAEELDEILQAHKMMSAEEPVFFFDEIQNIAGWEHFARRLVNNKYRVFITGSNAKMLSREIATTLGGRYLTKHIFPYSFAEYLRASGIVLSADWHYGSQDAEIGRVFNDYLYYGGLPDVVHIVTKRYWLNEMFSKILLSDIIVRNAIRSEESLRLTVRRLAESVMHPIAINRLVGMVKSTGQTMSRNTMIDYIAYLHDSCLIFTLENLAAKFSERATVKKYYFVDNGLLNIFLKTPATILLENLVAAELKRRYAADHSVWFYNDSIEIDFVVPEEQQAIQVAWDITESDTLQRETRSLELFHKRYADYSLTIITRHDSLSLSLADGTVVEVLPIWKWLLSGHA